MGPDPAGARWRAGRILVVLAAVVWILAAVGCSNSPKHSLHRVAIRSFKFEPATLTIAAGDTVEWSNQDIVPHTATRAQSWDSGSILSRGSWRWVAQGQGTLDYQCTFHPTMKAALVIR